MPEHSMHSVMPRLMLAHRGSTSPQSQHTALPAMPWTLWSELSPFRSFSFVSQPDSGLPVEGGGFLSTFGERQKGKKAKLTTPYGSQAESPKVAERDWAPPETGDVACFVPAARIYFCSVRILPARFKAPRTVTKTLACIGTRNLSFLNSPQICMEVFSLHGVKTQNHSFLPPPPLLRKKKKKPPDKRNGQAWAKCDSPL